MRKRLAVKKVDDRKKSALVTQETRWFKKFRLSGKAAFRLLEVFGLVLLIPTAYVLFVDLKDRQAQRISEAWQQVIANAPGNSGKVQALDYLNSDDCVSRYQGIFKKRLHEELGENQALRSQLEVLRFCGFSYFRWPRKKKTELVGIDLSSNTHGSQVFLQKVNLEKAVLYNSNFAGADLTDAILVDASLQNTDMTGANLAGSNLSNADLSEATLTGADLTDAVIAGAKLLFADLRRSDLSGATLVGADLTNANLTDANLVSDQILIQPANLSRAYLNDATLSRADLRYVNLSHAYLHYATLDNADLRLANFSYADLWMSNLSKSDFTYGYLHGADMSSTNLRGTTFFKAEMAGVNLSNADFGAVPDLRVTYLLGSNEISYVPFSEKSGAYFLEGQEPRAAPSVLRNLTMITPAQGCTWLQGQRLFECVDISR